MNKKKSIIIAILIVLAVIVVCAVLYTKYTRTDQYLTIKEPDIVNGCKMRLASDWDVGFQCILDLGKSISDPKSCNVLADSPQSKDPNVQKQDFVAICQNAIAVEKKDISICSSIISSSDKYTSAFRNTCYISIAKETKDESICNNILTPTEHAICVTNTKEGISKCQSIAEDGARNYCYNTLAVHDKDVSVCNNISGKNAANDKEFCVAFVAGAVNNLQMCNTIKTVTTRDYCVANVIELNKLDRKLCDNAGSRKDMCYAYPR